MAAPDARRAVEAVWRIESGRLIAALARTVGDVGLAEEFAQDALVAALERRPASGLAGTIQRCSRLERGLAQPGNAHGSGPRGPGFESRAPGRFSGTNPPTWDQLAAEGRQATTAGDYSQYRRANRPSPAAP